MQSRAFNRPHLVAALVASAALGLVLALGLHFCRDLERRYIHTLAGEFPDAKLQGAVLQKHAFADPKLLVLYGSSELAKEMPNNPCHFFADYPTGFRVFAVGKPGTTALAVLQKVAAVGKELEGRKLVYLISPGVFFSEVFEPTYYEGNFSDLQATELAFSAQLDRTLKRDVARRMLQFPRTVEGKWLLDFTLRRLAGDTPLDRLLYAAAVPFGQLQKRIARAQDHLASALMIVRNRAELDRQPAGVRGHVDWNDRLAHAADFTDAAALQAKKNEVAQRRAAHDSRGEAILRAVTNAREWTDIELLLRTLRELHAQPLLLSMPVEDIRLDVYDAPAQAREIYLERVHALAAKYQVPLLDFREHEKDPSFLFDFLDHLSGKGWLYYDKAIDDFFHDRPLNDRAAAAGSGAIPHEA